MKKKRATIEIVIEYPAKQNPFDYMDFKGGQLINIVSKKITKEEDLGDIDTPWAQKMREFNAVKKIIGDGVRAALKDQYYVTIYGGTYGSFNYSISIHEKKDGPKVPDWIYNRLNLDIDFDKGTLVWTTRWNNPEGKKPVTRMSVGDPEISAKIEKFVEERIAK